MPIDYGTLPGYPLSLGFFMQCYLRCLNRKGHLTFPSEDPERVVKLLARFFRQFKDVKFDSSFLAKGFEILMPVTLTEGEHFELPSNLEKLLTQIIVQGVPASETLVPQFCKAVEVYRKVFGASEPSKTTKEVAQVAAQLTVTNLTASADQVAEEPAKQVIKRCPQPMIDHLEVKQQPATH